MKLFKFASRAIKQLSNSIFFIRINYKSHVYDLKNIIGVGFRDIIFIYDGNKVEIFFIEEDLKKLKKPIIDYISTKMFKSHFLEAKKIVEKIKNETIKRNEKKIVNLFKRETKSYVTFYVIISLILRLWYDDLPARQKKKLFKIGDQYITPFDAIINRAQEVIAKYLEKNIIYEKWMQKAFIFSKGKFFKKKITKFFEEKNFEYKDEKINLSDKKIIKGITAYGGIAKGVVKIVFGLKDFGKVKNGDIIVTTMTKPVFTPVFPKIKAIITDEGGILSHAAIISRELKIPCVVGTKIATKVLKDGDLVEVNADKGVVRILEKAK